MVTNPTPPREDAPGLLPMAGWAPMEVDPKSVANWSLPPDHPLAIICTAATEEAAQAIADALNRNATPPAAPTDNTALGTVADALNAWADQLVAGREISPSVTGLRCMAIALRAALSHQAPQAVTVECTHSHGRSVNDRCLNCGRALGGRT